MIGLDNTARHETRLELWEEHLKDIVALDTALKCVENQY